MQIYYFTRTGRSEKIARELAARYGCPAHKIEDNKNWSGALGYIRAGFNATTGKSCPATYVKPTEDNLVVLVCPIWAGTVPPAVKTFTSEVGKERIICVATSLGSVLRDKSGYAKVIDLVGDPISAPASL